MPLLYLACSLCFKVGDSVHVVSDHENHYHVCVFFIGRLRYANNSNYKNDTMIRKEVHHVDYYITMHCYVYSSILFCLIPCFHVLNMQHPGFCE